MADISKEPIHRVLHAHPFFAGLDETLLAKLADCATTRTFTGGEVLLKEGACADRFYLLVTGTVAVEVAAPGHGKVVLQTLHDGDVLGWSWLVAPYRWSFDATARGPVETVVFDAPCLRRVFEANHEIPYHLMPRFVGIMAERIHAARLQMLDLYGPPPQDPKSESVS